MSFTCPRCGMTSHHPQDERHGYCGNCHEFTGVRPCDPNDRRPIWEQGLAAPTTDPELQLWYDLRRAADQMALAKWRAAHPNAGELFIPEQADLVIWLLDQLAGTRLYAEIKRWHDSNPELQPLPVIKPGIKAETLQELLHALITEGIISPNTARKVQRLDRDAIIQILKQFSKADISQGDAADAIIDELQRGAPGMCPHCKRDDGSHDNWCRYFSQDIAARLGRVDASLAKRVGEMINRDAAIRVTLDDWLKAYPLDIFPEPDLAKAAKLLNAGGLTLDAISASISRHVLKRVLKLMDDSPDMTA